MRLLLRVVRVPQDTGHGRATGAATAKTVAASGFAAETCDALVMVASAGFAAETSTALVMFAAAAAMGGRAARPRRRSGVCIRAPIDQSYFAVAARRTMPPLLDGDMAVVGAAGLLLVRRRRVRASAPTR